MRDVVAPSPLGVAKQMASLRERANRSGRPPAPRMPVVALPAYNQRVVSFRRREESVE